jgi:DNA-binding cell septation regulator SpoVG
MKISIESYPDSDRFNVCLSSKEGAQPFLTIKGCKLMDGRKGQFISWPAWKNKNDEWKSHCYASEGFQAAVIDAVKAAKPADTRTHAERKKPLADMDNDVPW